MTPTMKGLLMLVGLVPAMASRDSSFYVNTFTCSKNSAVLTYASCGYYGEDPCVPGDEIDFAGQYLVNTKIPTENLEICGVVKAGGSYQKTTCYEIEDLCDYVNW